MSPVGASRWRIGAGWYEHEWLAYGYGFPGAGERLRALDEGVRIFVQAWREGNVTLDGATYQVDGAIVQPLPLQDSGIPLWIAGGGERKTSGFPRRERYAGSSGALLVSSAKSTERNT